MEANEKNDIYSFGVLSVEVVVGRHPGNLMSSISSLLWSSSSSTLSNIRDLQLKGILDQRLPCPTDQVAEEVVQVIKVAISCIHPNPKCRPSMKEVVKFHQRKQEEPQEDCLNITLGQLLEIRLDT